jgi:hypothetical protein
MRVVGSGRRGLLRTSRLDSAHAAGCRNGANAATRITEKQAIVINTNAPFMVTKVMS